MLENYRAYVMDHHLTVVLQKVVVVDFLPSLLLDLLEFFLSDFISSGLLLLNFDLFVILESFA